MCDVNLISAVTVKHIQLAVVECVFAQALSYIQALSHTEKLTHVMDLCVIQTRFLLLFAFFSLTTIWGFTRCNLIQHLNWIHIYSQIVIFGGRVKSLMGNIALRSPFAHYIIASSWAIEPVL